MPKIIEYTLVSLDGVFADEAARQDSSLDGAAECHAKVRLLVDATNSRLE